MGQKVHPFSLRLGITQDWISRWWGGKDFAKLLHEDIKIRRFLTEKFKRANVSKILIERGINKVRVSIFAGRPGIIIGKGGETIESAKEELEKLSENSKVFLNVQEVNQPDLDAHLVAERIAFQLQRRTSAKRTMREAISRIMELGAEGARIACKGRIGGAEIARKEWMREGRIPLHTLRADIDYGVATAHTTYGCIGVKVWICKGEISPPLREEKAENEITAKEG